MESKMRNTKNETSDTHLELIVPVVNKGSQTFQFAFPASARASSVLLVLANLRGAREQRTFDLSTPLFDLSRFRYPTVNLAQREP